MERTHVGSEADDDLTYAGQDELAAAEIREDLESQLRFREHERSRGKSASSGDAEHHATKELKAARERKRRMQAKAEASHGGGGDGGSRATASSDGGENPRSTAPSSVDWQSESGNTQSVAGGGGQGRRMSTASASSSAAAIFEIIRDGKDPARGGLKGREGLLVQALATDPRNVDALVRLGLLYEQKEQWHKVIELLTRATMIDTRERTTRMKVHIAHAHLRLGRYEFALEAYQLAAAEVENRVNPTLFYGLGVLYDRIDNREIAEQSLRQCIKLSPFYTHSREVYFRLGSIYRDLEKYERAYYCLHKALTDGNGEGLVSPGASWLELGVVCRLLAKDDEAEAAFANAGLDPDNGETWLVVGYEYLEKGEQAKAFRAFRKAVHLDRENHRTWTAIIDLYKAMGQDEEALEAYYGFSVIDVAVKLRHEHEYKYEQRIIQLEKQLARQREKIVSREGEKKYLEGLVTQQQRIVQQQNSDLEGSRSVRSAREAFLEMQLKEAMKRDGQMSEREQAATQLMRKFQKGMEEHDVQKEEWREREQSLNLQLSVIRTGEQSGLLPGEVAYASDEMLQQAALNGGAAAAYLVSYDGPRPIDTINETRRQLEELDQPTPRDSEHSKGSHSQEAWSRPSSAADAERKRIGGADVGGGVRQEASTLPPGSALAGNVAPNRFKSAGAKVRKAGGGAGGAAGGMSRFDRSALTGAGAGKVQPAPRSKSTSLFKKAGGSVRQAGAMQKKLSTRNGPKSAANNFTDAKRALAAARRMKRVGAGV